MHVYTLTHILLSVFLFLASASDYSLSDDKITIDSSDATFITLSGVPDEILEGNETVVIQVSTAPFTSYPGVTFPQLVTVIINDAEGMSTLESFPCVRDICGYRAEAFTCTMMLP